MSFAKEFIAPALTLTVICAAVSAVLVATYDLTYPVIEAARIEKENQARVQLLPAGDSFAQLANNTAGVSAIYSANNGAGYVISATATGYNGPLTVMVGIDQGGIIQNVMLMDNSETVGLGSKVGETAYTSQYVGKDSSLVDIDVISGATVSSNAFKNAVTSAFVAYGEEIGSPIQQPQTITEIPLIDGAVSAFQSTKQGFVSEVAVDVYFDENDAVLKIVPDVSGETPNYGGKYANASYTDQWVGNTSGFVDVISGATATGNAINDAVQQAFKALQGE